MMTSEETMDLLSSVRLGINLGLLEEITIPTVNELFIQTQPAHLQKLMGASLDGEERNAARARYLRTRLREAGPQPNCGKPATRHAARGPSCSPGRNFC